MSSRTQFKQNYLRDIAFVIMVWCHDVTETLFFLIANFYLLMLYKAFTSIVDDTIKREHTSR